MNGGTCLHETPGKRLPRGRKKNVRCNRSSLLTNSLPYKEGQVRKRRHPLTAARLPPTLVSQVDRYARENKISRSEAIKRLLERGLAGLKP